MTKRQHKDEGDKIEINEYGPDLKSIVDGKGKTGRTNGRIFEGTETDPKLAPKGRVYEAGEKREAGDDASKNA